MRRDFHHRAVAVSWTLAFVASLAAHAGLGQVLARTGWSGGVGLEASPIVSVRLIRDSDFEGSDSEVGKREATADVRPAQPEAEAGRSPKIEPNHPTFVQEGAWSQEKRSRPPRLAEDHDALQQPTVRPLAKGSGGRGVSTHAERRAQTAQNLSSGESGAEAKEVGGADFLRETAVRCAAATEDAHRDELRELRDFGLLPRSYRVKLDGGAASSEGASGGLNSFSPVDADAVAYADSLLRDLFWGCVERAWSGREETDGKPLRSLDLVVTFVWKGPAN